MTTEQQLDDELLIRQLQDHSARMMSEDIVLASHLNVAAIRLKALARDLETSHHRHRLGAQPVTYINEEAAKYLTPEAIAFAHELARRVKQSLDDPTTLCPIDMRLVRAELAELDARYPDDLTGDDLLARIIDLNEQVDRLSTALLDAHQPAALFAERLATAMEMVDNPEVDSTSAHFAWVDTLGEYRSAFPGGRPAPQRQSEARFHVCIATEGDDDNGWGLYLEITETAGPIRGRTGSTLVNEYSTQWDAEKAAEHLRQALHVPEVDL